MATSGKGKTLVADRRSAAPSKRTAANAPDARKPRKKNRGWTLRILLFVWAIVWGVMWRVTAVGALILGFAVLFFFVQLPPLDGLLDGRARGSVTMQDRDGAVFAWRGETFGGRMTSPEISKLFLVARQCYEFELS